MPIKRRRPKERLRTLSPEAIAAFRRMEAAETQEEWSAAHFELHEEDLTPLAVMQDNMDFSTARPASSGPSSWVCRR